MNKSILIVTADERLASVLSIEAAVCGAQAQRAQEIQGMDAAEWEHICAAIVDLDGKIGGAIPEQVRVLGLCRDPEALPLRARRIAHMIFRRPFLAEDLRRELRALTRESEDVAAPASAVRVKEALVLKEDSRCALMGNRQLPLSQKEFMVLSLLLQKGEEGISKQELDALLDAKETNEGQVYICHLRRKLEQAFDLQPIKTVRNKGYVYVGP